MMIVSAFVAVLVLLGIAVLSKDGGYVPMVLVIAAIVVVLISIGVIVKLMTVAIAEWMMQHPPVMSFSDDALITPAGRYLWASIMSVEKQGISKVVLMLNDGTMLIYRTGLWSMSAKAVVERIKSFLKI